MGVEDFIHFPDTFSAPYSQSDYLPDYIVNPHPRFAALTCNIRLRRGKKVDIHMPLYKDIHTYEYLRQDSMIIDTDIVEVLNTKTDYKTTDVNGNYKRKLNDLNETYGK
jgi:hypothetical protein